MLMKPIKNQFKKDVLKLVGVIPKGRVMTYGQIAALCGAPNGARAVGTIAHFGPSELPWQRVVNKSGGLASAYTYGGRGGQKAQLEADGVIVGKDNKIDVKKYIWWPK
jgi:methylated-DNA-protein-cysteine methyltransferase related protein